MTRPRGRPSLTCPCQKLFRISIGRAFAFIVNRDTGPCGFATVSIGLAVTSAYRGIKLGTNFRFGFANARGVSSATCCVDSELAIFPVVAGGPT
jgi:hypothetical protein